MIGVLEANLFEPIAKYFGLPKEQLKLVWCVLVSYPLCGVLKRLPDSRPCFKNLFSIAVSLFFLLGVFDLVAGLITMLVSALGTYLITSKLSNPFMPWICFIFVMGHMSVTHVWRLFYGNDELVDISGAQMVLCMKLTAYAWNVYDGRLKQDTLTSIQQKHSLPTPPRILDFLGYVFFFPSLLTGPSYDFAEYKNWIDTSMFDENISTGNGNLSKRRIPRSGRPGMYRAVQGVVWLFAFAKLSGPYSTHFALSDSFLEYSFLRRVWYVCCLGFTARCKYYGIWLLSEGACIVSGLGFNGLDQRKKARWNRVRNIDPLGIEFGQNSKGVLDSWNMNTNKWLRNYVYLRVTPKGKKPGFRSTMATFITSAIWHGFYSGYYLTFLTGAFIQTVGKLFRRHLRPFFLSPDGKALPNKRYYDILCWMVTHVTYDYMVLPFQILTFKNSLKIWTRLYVCFQFLAGLMKFFVHIGIALSMILLSSPVLSWVQRYMRYPQTSSASSNNFVKDEQTVLAPPLGIPSPDQIIADSLDFHREMGEKNRSTSKRSKKIS